MWQTCVCVHVGADTQARSTTTMQILDMYHVPLRCSVRYYMENLHAVNSVKKAMWPSLLSLTFTRPIF